MVSSKKEYIRKLQKISRSYLVSLPSDFLIQHNLKETKDASVIIEINDDWSLTIRPHIFEREDKEEITIEIYREIAREIVEKILSGTMKIQIISDKKIDEEVKQEIHLFVDGLPQAEIIEETNQRIIVINLEFKNLPTRQILHRILSILLEIFENVRESNYDKMELNIKDLKKFYVILVGKLRSFHNRVYTVDSEENLTNKIASDYRVFAYQIKTIAYILKDIEIDESFLDYFLKIKDYFNEIFDAFLEKNERLAHKLWFKNRFIENEGLKLKNETTLENKLKIEMLLIIVKICRNMTALIFN